MSPAVQPPKSCEVVARVALGTHHLAHETFRRLFLLLRQSPAATQPRGTRQVRVAHERFPLAKDRGRLLRAVSHRSTTVRTRLDHGPNKIQLSFPHNTLASHRQSLAVHCDGTAPVGFVQQSPIMASSEALDPENRSTSSVYPNQLSDTASHLHAKFLLSQLGLKPPRISSATITNTKGLSGRSLRHPAVHRDTAIGGNRNPNGLPENCSTTSCRAQPPIEDKGFCDITFQQCCRGKYDQMLS